jgi:hydrophobic/amphiphilic exporter-1 (mainly G- bacteria), HAE1 family
MTSFAFIAGLIPLCIANGAGAMGNRSIGNAAAGGMLAGTIFGIFLIPGLYGLFMYRRTKKKGNKNVPADEEEPLTESMIHHENTAKQ